MSVHVSDYVLWRDARMTDPHHATVTPPSHYLPRHHDVRLSRFQPLERILAYDDFNTGTHGWVELLGNYDGHSNLDTVDDHMHDFRPPQLSSCSFFDVGTHGAMSGTYALKVATRPEAGHTAVAIRRLTMAGRGRVQFETYFTYKAEAASEENDTASQAGGVGLLGGGFGLVGEIRLELDTTASS